MLKPRFCGKPIACVPAGLRVTRTPVRVRAEEESKSVTKVQLQLIWSWDLACCQEFLERHPGDTAQKCIILSVLNP